ncbi:MAG: DNA mismatch repair endonuclease MutL [Saprospiraceae bacterium]
MDIIKLLPDSLANQIAAGEVIQRPASVVKELLENAIDAGATRIQLLIKDAGKTLIQVIDNGAGMSETDARMSFERHATSKIKFSEDLEHIRTMGFRGEALASIAAIAQLELKTKPHDQDLGTRILISGSKLEKQEPIQYPGGTSFSVSNLFFNTPARRKFLKSDPVELKNILEEFEHIALAYPEVEMTCHNGDTEIYILSKGNLKQRIMAVFGKSMNEKIVAIEEHTDLVNMGGFIGKIEACKKKRGEQYLFVNRRYIKSNYLHHAIKAAYESLIGEEDHPFYVLFLDLDPTRIDVNVHPSKHEIKFLDERIIYQYLRVATRHALGQYVPLSLDFESGDKGISNQITSSIYNPEARKNYGTQFGQPTAEKTSIPNQDWRKLYEILKAPDESKGDSIAAILINSQINNEDQLVPSTLNASDSERQYASKDPYQIHLSYIISPVASGLMIVDQETAHRRILYEKSLKQMTGQAAPSQRSLFPTTIQMSGSDQIILNHLIPDLKQLGFDLEPFGTNNFIIHGSPADWSASISIHHFIEELVKEYAHDESKKSDYKTYLAYQISKSQGLKQGQSLTVEEMKFIIDQLFACEEPAFGPSGGRCYTIIELQEIEKRMR